MEKLRERYDNVGVGYSTQRQPDQRIFEFIQAVLGSAESILNVGAGTGSYEPIHVPTVAVKPSYEMIQPRLNKNNVVQGSAEALPFKDAAFDATLAVLTVHHWTNLNQGLQECARSSRRTVTIVTWDPDLPGFWLTQDYFPEILEFDRSIFPSMEELRKHLGPITVQDIPIPANCVDEFLGAYWQRPAAYLQEQVRSGMSSFSRIPTSVERLEMLKRDLESGAWYQAHGQLLTQESLNLGYRLVTAVVH